MRLVSTFFFVCLSGEAFLSSVNVSVCHVLLECGQDTLVAVFLGSFWPASSCLALLTKCINRYATLPHSFVCPSVCVAYQFACKGERKGSDTDCGADASEC